MSDENDKRDDAEKVFDALEDKLDPLIAEELMEALNDLHKAGAEIKINDKIWKPDE